MAKQSERRRPGNGATELMAFSRDLHNDLRDYAKLAEAEKPLVVSAVMIALQDSAFESTYRTARGDELPAYLLQALDRQFKRAQMPRSKQRVVEQPYRFIEHHAVLNRIPQDEALTPLQRIVIDVDEHVRPFVLDHPDVDVLGQFYGEFLRYSGGDGKGLGIVLTPRHVTELFAHLADVGPHDTVLDTCCGTASFLISAMARMDDAAGNDQQLRERIRSQGLVGIEQRPDMFALAVANMLLRGDGKANLYQADCFETQVGDAIKRPPAARHSRPNIGFINPPYAQKGQGLDELSFVATMLDYLAPGGTGIAIVPMSVAISPNDLKAELLAQHSLAAVMSMPNDLFHKVGTFTCVMVWKAHHPHDPAAGTWLGYWKDDGFVKTKRAGRVDRDGRWPAIREQWLSAYRGREQVPGHSVVAHLGATDEWVAEAHMETDYSSLCERDFADVVREYALHLVDLQAREDA
jgi:type I restriction enzyme M protein